MPEPLAATVQTLRTHVATSRHAEMLFDVLVDLLGDQCVLWTANQGHLRRLFRRDPYDPTRIVPWPLAELSVGGRIGWVSAAFDARTGEPAPERGPLPGKPSRLRGLGPAELGLIDGPAHINVVFGDDGSVLESSVDAPFPTRLDKIPEAVASKRGPAVELIAACVALLDPGVHGPGRVELPVPIPGGPATAWLAGLYAARRALFAGAIGRDDRYIVADGVSGAAIGTGSTLAGATAQFEARVAEAPPAPDVPEPTTPDDDSGGRGDASSEPWTPVGRPGLIDLTGGGLRFRGPTPDALFPRVTVASVPRVIIPLAASPPVAPAIGTWERTIGARGTTSHVLRETRDGGSLQIGERLLWRVDPRTVETTLDRLDTESAAIDAAIEEASTGRDFIRYRARTYRWTEATSRRPAGLERAGGSSGVHFDGSTLDGDVEAQVVRRHRHLPRRT